MDIRKLFLDYFKRKDHLVLPSASLIPENDPTVLLTTAGMQPFKPYYLGIKKPPKTRITTVQKCFRTSDIDSVGYTERHLTFFEMLGNFSFGDYFKKEAIEFAMDFVLNVLKLPMEKLWITVFRGGDGLSEDEESVEIWRKVGINPRRIYKFGKDENFWGPAGETGPCGPCSEIIYDFGKEYGCGKESCSPGCECGRFLEIWNLVFTQYNFDGHKYTELPSKNIDTGMGLERIVAALEGNSSVFKTSLFKEILTKIEEISEKKLTCKSDPEYDPEINRSIKIIADHSRAIYFLVSDGVVPSNEGRGYILRRIIRRAIRFGRILGIDDYFLNDIGSVIIDKYSGVYPELRNRKDFSFKLVRDEEKRFSKTLKEGTKVLIQNIKQLKANNKKFLDSKDGFKLYDTFGFPVELTMEILKEHGLKLDLDKFNKYLEKHSEISRDKTLFDKKIDKNMELYRKISEKIGIDFVGYQENKITSSIVNIIKNTDKKEKILASSISQGEEGEIILKVTPFYGEKGGQIGDKGIIKSLENVFVVEDCKIPIEGIYIHKGRMKKGKLKVGDEVSAEVDMNFRKSISKNHTATHLLHWTLRSIFGKEVVQSGSFVGPDRLRFDYTIYGTPSIEQLERIEKIINEKIQNDDVVRCFETTKEYADEIGAISLFGEKYGKFVRVVEIDNYSRELCGGTHVNRTGEIGVFKIISESSIGANLRRIEAVTGMHAYHYLVDRQKILKDISDSMEIDEYRLKDAVNDMKNNLERIKEELNLLQRKMAKKEILDKFKPQLKEDGLKIIDFDFSKADYSYDLDVKSLGMLGDEIKNMTGCKNTFIVLGNVINDKPVLLLQTTKDLTRKGIDCGKIAKEAGKKLKGGGGGKPNFAQAGGSESRCLGNAIVFIRDMVLEKLKE